MRPLSSGLIVQGLFFRGIRVSWKGSLSVTRSGARGKRRPSEGRSAQALEPAAVLSLHRLLLLLNRWDGLSRPRICPGSSRIQPEPLGPSQRRLLPACIAPSPQAFAVVPIHWEAAPPSQACPTPTQAAQTPEVLPAHSAPRHLRGRRLAYAVFRELCVKSSILPRAPFFTPHTFWFSEPGSLISVTYPKSPYKKFISKYI